MPKIEKVIPKQAPTLLDASKANELIGFVNGLLESKGDGGINVIVEDSGRLVISLNNDEEEEEEESDDEGLLIFRANGTQEFIPSSNILAGYNSSNDANWSLQFAVTFTRLVGFGTTAPFGTSATDRFDGDAENAQTFYRLPVIRTVGGIKQKLSVGGVYRENIVCVSGVPTVELLKIG